MKFFADAIVQLTLLLKGAKKKKKKGKRKEPVNKIGCNGSMLRLQRTMHFGTLESQGRSVVAQAWLQGSCLGCYYKSTGSEYRFSKIECLYMVLSTYVD